VHALSFSADHDNDYEWNVMSYFMVAPLVIRCCRFHWHSIQWNGEGLCKRSQEEVRNSERWINPRAWFHRCNWDILLLYQRPVQWGSSIGCWKP